jgi:hypothetical protein
MDNLDKIIKEKNKEEIIDFKKIRNLINHYILTYTKDRIESVNNIRELKNNFNIIRICAYYSCFIRRR